MIKRFSRLWQSAAEHRTDKAFGVGPGASDELIVGVSCRVQRRVHFTEIGGRNLEHVRISDHTDNGLGMFLRDVRRAISLYPETESVAIVSTAPLGRGLNTTSYNDAPRIKITRIAAEPGFFALMKIPILVGRDFVPGDDYRSTVIISRRVAMEMYGKLDVLGKSFPKSVCQGDREAHPTGWLARRSEHRYCPRPIVLLEADTGRATWLGGMRSAKIHYSERRSGPHAGSG